MFAHSALPSGGHRNYGLTIRFALATAALLLQAPSAGAQDATPQAGEDAQVQEFRRQLRALNWIVGPQQVQLFDIATLKVPENFVFLGTADTAKFETLQKELSGDSQYFFGPKDFHWQVFFRFSADGYVKDKESIDAAAILKNIQENTEAANEERRQRGYDEMEVTGWQTAPHYDGQTHHLEWAILGRDKKTGEQVVNFNTRILGRGGVMSVVMATDPQALAAAIPEFKDRLDGFDYLPGQRYAEYKPGDKLAKYGLAALITGGAVAIAVKTGFWKVILGALIAGWKFVVAGAVALFGGISRFFKRKSPPSI